MPIESVTVKPSPGLRSPPIRGPAWPVAGRPDGPLQLTLRWARARGGPIDGAALRGLTDREFAAAAATPVELRIERESGVADRRSTFQGGSGSGTGRFRFVPPEALVQMKVNGVRSASAPGRR